MLLRALLSFFVTCSAGCATDWTGTYQALDKGWVARDEAPLGLTLELGGEGDVVEGVLKQDERAVKLTFERQAKHDLVCTGAQIGKGWRFPRQGVAPPNAPTVNGHKEVEGQVTLQLQHKDAVQGEGHLLVVVTRGSGVHPVFLGRLGDQP